MLYIIINFDYTIYSRLNHIYPYWWVFEVSDHNKSINIAQYSFSQYERVWDYEYD